MELVKVKKNYQITIPQNLRKRIRVEIGDYLEVDVKDNVLVVRPVKVVRADQEYFHTKEWQDKEAEADKDIEEGNVIGSFDNAKDAVKALKRAKI